MRSFCKHFLLSLIFVGFLQGCGGGGGTGSPPINLAAGVYTTTANGAETWAFLAPTIDSQTPNWYAINFASGSVHPDFYSAYQTGVGTSASTVAVTKHFLGTATTGNGGTQHLTSEMFQMMANVKLQHVPYRGSAPALQDLVAGSVDLMFDNLGVSLPLVKGGQLNLIAVATAKRLEELPEVPTIAETIPGFESAAWFGVVAPPKTPKAIVDKLNADINEALRDPEVKRRLAQLSSDVVGGSPDETARYMREEVERWAKVIKAANIKVD